jgi:LmbE family N-acetylglucosaminyl deacetylase
MSVPSITSSQRILVLSPHPDDESIGCGGTLRSHVLAGDEVRVICLTSGEAGGHGRDTQDTMRLRECEALAAGMVVGISDTQFWRQPDGQLQATADLTARLQTYLSEWPPHIIYVTHEREMHADHRAAAMLVRQAIAVNGLRAAVRMYEVWTPLQELDDIIDISDFWETKLAAVRAHASQCEVVAFDEAVRGLNRYRGELHSWPGGDYAEVFQRMRF